MASDLQFRHEVIDPDPPASELDVCLPVDLTGTGRDDVIVGKPYNPENQVDALVREE